MQWHLNGPANAWCTLDELRLSFQSVYHIICTHMHSSTTIIKGIFEYFLSTFLYLKYGFLRLQEIRSNYNYYFRVNVWKVCGKSQIKIVYYKHLEFLLLYCNCEALKEVQCTSGNRLNAFVQVSKFTMIIFETDEYIISTYFWMMAGG